MTIRRKRWISLTITVLWIAFIFARSAKPAAESGAESAALLELLCRFFPALTDHAVRKAAHFTEYFILGALFFADWRLLRCGPVLLLLGLGAAVACVDEFIIQTHTPGRSGELRDVLLDTAGVATAVGLCLLFRRRKERRSRGRDGKET